MTNTLFILSELITRSLDSFYRKLSSRKCQVVKELANPEIVQMPFVTESFKISLIVPIQEKDSQEVCSYLMERYYELAIITSCLFPDNDLTEELCQELNREE